MEPLKETLWLCHPEVDDFFENQDFSAALMVVDMQIGFIIPYLQSNISNKFKDYYHQLEENICNRINDILNNSWIIINVTMLNSWGISPRVSEVFKNNQSRIIGLEKRNKSLLSRDNKEEELIKAKKILSTIRERNMPIELCWIHTSQCVKETWLDIDDMGIDVQIPLWTTMNLFQTQCTALAIANSMHFIREAFYGFEDVIDYRWKPKDLLRLTDYL